jgi:2-polyprenyl-3-methyl-5-hydroxy-6-metoxy-1,4-benzoquinol methylase
MNASFCSACENELVNLGKITDGILFKCPFCGSKKIYVEDYISKKDESSYSDAYINRLDDNKISGIMNLFNKGYSGSDGQAELLDIGFGNGNFLIATKKKGITVSGMDCDINSVNRIMQQGINAYQGELGGIMNIDKKYNIITLWDVLEHVVDIEKALSQLNFITKMSGRVFILTPNVDSLFDFFADVERGLTFYKSNRIINICLNRYHLQRFSVKGLKILFERFGFFIEHFELLQLFSLRSAEYTDGFAPGIVRWTNYSSFNRLISSSAMALIKILKIRNKIFLIARKG